MNVKRYRVSGSTHSSGADAMSVAICWVTPSSSDDGMKASAIHIKRSRGPIVAVASVIGSGASARLRDNMIVPHAAMPRASAAKPADHSVACRSSGSSGSTTSG